MTIAAATIILLGALAAARNATWRSHLDEEVRDTRNAATAMAIVIDGILDDARRELQYVYTRIRA